MSGRSIRIRPANTCDACWIKIQNRAYDEEEIICTHIVPRDDGNSVGTVLTTAGVATGTAVVGTAAATAGLTMAGFTGSGIAAGSFAAGMQASIGNVAAGSMFATLQSIGATGGFAVLGPLGLALGALGGGIYLLNRNRRN